MKSFILALISVEYVLFTLNRYRVPSSQPPENFELLSWETTELLLVAQPDLGEY